MFSLRNLPGLFTKPVARLRRLDRDLIKSYLPDWVFTIVLLVVSLLLDKINGFKREFSLSDTSLHHTFAVHERVPVYALYLIALLAPLLLQWWINLATIRSWWDAHISALGLLLSLSLDGFLTLVIKITVGRPRPDLISRCRPDPGAVDPTFGLSTIAICHQSDRHIINDGFKSFPSGHASISFAGLTFLSLYITGKLHLFDTRGYTLKAWVSIFPLCVATLVAISRTMDYRHHWHDVVAGSLLGLVTAYFVYRQYFRSLTSRDSHRPYSPRTRHHDPAPGLPV